MSPHLNIVLFESILDPEKGIHQTSKVQKPLKDWASGKIPFTKNFMNVIVLISFRYRFFNSLSFYKALMLIDLQGIDALIVLQGFQVYKYI